MKGDISVVLGEAEGLAKLPESVREKPEHFQNIYIVFKELLETRRFNELFQKFHAIAGVPIAVIDLDANVLASSKWQRICTDYHRAHAVTCQRCIESDTSLAFQLEAGNRFNIYRCKNGLTDCASPIFIEGEHIANLFIGQFLLEPPDLPFFKHQAETFAFDPAGYLEALGEVPIVPQARAQTILEFLVLFAELFGSMGVDRLHESQATLASRLGRIVEQSQNEIFVFDAKEYNFLLVNQGARKQLGYSSEELFALKPTDLLTDYNLDTFGELLRPLRDRRVERLIIETNQRRKDGKLEPIELHLQMLAFEQPQVFLAFAQDISERKELEALRTEVEHITRHDLKTPLNAIIGIPPLLRETGNLDDRQKQLLGLIEDAGYKMLQQINNSLNLYRIESGTYHFTGEPVSLQRLLRKVTNELSLLASQYKVELVLDELEVFALGEELLSISLFSNLVKNAIEASPATGAVHITLKEDGSWVEVQIANQGAVPTSVRDRFFQKLVTFGKPEGTGLGTYSAKLLTEIQGGTIWMQTSESEGTRITVRLPQTPTLRSP